MKELDLLKKDWNKDKNQFKQISINDLGSMLQKKSSSIVKKLFYISVAELFFWLGVNALPQILSQTVKTKMDAVEHNNELFFNIITGINFAVILVFVYLLYKSYKTISNTDNIKILMQNIIKTRKVIKSYVLFNLASIFIGCILGILFSIKHDPELANQIHELSNSQISVVFIISIIIIFIGLLLIWVFYKLLYGFLIDKLNKNYIELNKLDY